MIETLPSSLIFEVLSFVSALDVGHLRRTCRRLKKVIPRDWTYQVLYVAQRTSKSLPWMSENQLNCEARSMQSLLRRLRFMTRLFIERVSFASCTDLVCTQSSLRDSNVIQVTNLRSISLRCPYLRDFLAIRSLDVTSIQLETPRLDSLYLLDLSLENFSIHPSWTRIRTLSLMSIGNVSTICIPETFRRLEYVHIAHVGLTELIVKLLPPFNHQLIINIREPHLVTVRMDASFVPHVYFVQGNVSLESPA
jgi:hypothetical protein